MGAPDGLGTRGATLWEALNQEAGTPSGELALEACRTADRLDDLDQIVQGKGVINLLTFRLQSWFDDEATGDRTLNVKVEFSNVLAESRQQQMALRQMLLSLGMEPGAAPSVPKGSPLDELRAKREARGGPPDSDAPRTTRERTAARRRR